MKKKTTMMIIIINIDLKRHKILISKRVKQIQIQMQQIKFKISRMDMIIMMKMKITAKITIIQFKNTEIIETTRTRINKVE